MGKHILLIQGHPDSSQRHLCHALEEAYAKGATGAGHEIKQIDVASLDFPLLRSQHEWENGILPFVWWFYQMQLYKGDKTAIQKIKELSNTYFVFNGSISSS